MTQPTPQCTGIGHPVYTYRETHTRHHWDPSMPHDTCSAAEVG